MKIKTAFFFLMFLSVFFSCKKEEEPISYTSPVWGSFSAYTKTKVVDSTTAAQVPGAEVYIASNSNGSALWAGTVISGGWYITHITWGLGPHNDPPGDSSNLYVCAHLGSESGFKKIKAGQLPANDTLTVPDVYVH